MLRQRVQWVAWKRDLRSGQTKPRKLPINPANGSLAKTNDASTWGSYEAAAERARQDDLAGVGYVLTGDDRLCGIDLDNCRNPTTGELSPIAAEVVALRETYFEVSPSGTGLRGFALGKPDRAKMAAGVEVYGTGRYLTVTGQHVHGTPNEIRLAPKTMERLIGGVAASRPLRQAAHFDEAVAGPMARDLPHPKLLAEVCPTFVRMVKEASTANEPLWFATLQVVRHTLGGDKLGHKLSKDHQDYTFKETQAKLDRLATLGMGPPTCGTLERLYAAESPCPSCPNYGRPGSSPIVFARRETGIGVKADEAGLENFYAYMPTHSYLHVPTGEFWPAASVDGRLPRVTVGTAPDGKTITIPPSRWLDKHRPVTQVTWTPGEPQVLRDRACRDGELTREPGATCFNLYRPPTPIEGGDPSRAGRWVELVHKLYPDEAEHIIAWAAHRVQRPGEKINHALVLGGAQGIGKDTLLQPLVKAVGSWNFSDIAPQQLADSFNTFVKCVVLRINEVHNLGDLTRPQFYEKSKTLITTPPEMIRVNQKYVNEYSVRNCCGVVMTTNYKAGGIYLAPDDRRHFVAWSNCGKDVLSPTYWTELWAWYESEGFAHVAALLRAHDLSSFNPKAPPPKTAAFWEIVNAGRAPEDAELAGAIDAMGTPEALTIKQLETATLGDDSLGTWISDRKNRRAIPYRLEQCGYVAVRNETAQDGYWAIEGKRNPVYARADLPERDRQRAAKALADSCIGRRSR